MKIKFPENFIFGTSTSACQIETGFEHDWLNVRSRDGHVLNETTEHEKRFIEDARIIGSLAPHYRMSMMWSKLQREPYGQFHDPTVREYSGLLKALNDHGVKVMMVLHHFANPTWFSRNGGWSNDENVDTWVDYCKQLVETFAPSISLWNTFNEPNLYTAMAYLAGEFPPYQKNLLTANRVIRNMARAHNAVYDHIKANDPGKMVGISHNCAVFEGENIPGKIPAMIIDWLYMRYAEDLFKKTDFFGMSYYARIGFDPFPITCLTAPQKIARAGKAHDDMWEYFPQGLEECIIRFWKKYRKPIIITENGICTSDDTKRIRAIADYLQAVWGAMAKGADVRGYYHWTAWDNFEWSLGPTFNFGLYSCDPKTKERKKRASATLYSQLAFTKELELQGSLD